MKVLYRIAHKKTSNRPRNCLFFDFSVLKSSLFGGLAQLVEHLHHTQGVAGSSPVLSTNEGKAVASATAFLHVTEAHVHRKPVPLFYSFNVICLRTRLILMHPDVIRIYGLSLHLREDTAAVMCGIDMTFLIADGGQVDICILLSYHTLPCIYRLKLCRLSIHRHG